MKPCAPVPSLGVGLTYQPKLQHFIDDNLALLDYMEVVPDTMWSDRGRGASPRYVDDPKGVNMLLQIRQEIPIVAHSIGLSIGSAHRFRHEHVAEMRRWYDWLDFPWHSDHLAYNLAQHGDDEVNVGITMQIPRDRESLRHLIPRARKVAATIPVPFALENNVYFFDLDDEEFDDATFLNRLCAESGCYLVLDLHNLYTNSRNHGKDPMETLARLDLDRVIEIHVAGGMEYDGFYLDSHSGATPQPVLDLLRYALLSCPNVGGVTFEILGSWFEVMGHAALREELSRLREMWHRYQPLPSRLAS